LNSEHKEIGIGAITLALLVGALGFMTQGHGLSSEASKTHHRVQAKFNKVDGLSEGSEVRMGGVKIGTVSSMELDQEFRAVVTLDIVNFISYPTDTSAAIHTDGLFGGKFVVLEPGAEEDNLKTGDQISLTQDAVIVSDLLDLIISEGTAAQAKRAESATQTN